MKRNEERRKKVIIALRKAETSLGKIIASVEKDSLAELNCFPVIQQSLSVIGLLKSANTLMLEGHIERELATWKGMSSKRREEFIAEILRVVVAAQKK